MPSPICSWTLLKFFLKIAQARVGGKPEIFWFVFIFSYKQHLRQLGYCAPPLTLLKFGTIPHIICYNFQVWEWSSGLDSFSEQRQWQQQNFNWDFEWRERTVVCVARRDCSARSAPSKKKTSGGIMKISQLSDLSKTIICTLSKRGKKETEVWQKTSIFWKSDFQVGARFKKVRMPRDLPESQNFNKELIQLQKEDAVKQKKIAKIWSERLSTRFCIWRLLKWQRVLQIAQNNP